MVALVLITWYNQFMQIDYFLDERMQLQMFKNLL